MTSLVRGRYNARLAKTGDDITAAQRLRSLAFRGVSGELDSDRFDAICDHVLVEDRLTDELVCCFRLLPLRDGGEIGRSYSAQHYDLSALLAFKGPVAEMGRFCVHPDFSDPDIVRIAWAMMTRIVDDNGVELLFGCVSFQGVEAHPYTDAFALLCDRHLAPKRWLPEVKSPSVVRFSHARARRRLDARRGLMAMPALLRSYMVMGGWVSDHAVIDRDLNTLHVFTGLEVRAIPPGRARILRAS